MQEEEQSKKKKKNVQHKINNILCIKTKKNIYWIIKLNRVEIRI